MIQWEGVAKLLTRSECWILVCLPSRTCTGASVRTLEQLKCPELNRRFRGFFVLVWSAESWLPSFSSRSTCFNWDVISKYKLTSEPFLWQTQSPSFMRPNRRTHAHSLQSSQMDKKVFSLLHFFFFFFKSMNWTGSLLSAAWNFCSFKQSPVHTAKSSKLGL